MTCYQLNFPSDVSVEGVASTLRTLSAQSRGRSFSPPIPVVFETILRPESVRWWIHVDDRRARHLRVAAERAIPGIQWTKANRPEIEIRQAVEVRLTARERLLAEDLAEPTTERLLGIAGSLRDDEVILIQWQVGAWLDRSPIPPASTPQPRTIWNLPDWGIPSRDSEQVTAARKKQSDHLFGSIGRVAVGGATEHRADQLIASAVNAYQLLRAPGVGVRRRSLPSWWVRRHLDPTRARVSRNDPSTRLTPLELAAVIGWPVGNPALPGVRYTVSRRLPLDDRCLVPVGSTDRVLGLGLHPSQRSQAARLDAGAGLRHLHVVGPSGTGKSTLLSHLILSDIAAGRGVVVIDPKGDLVTEVIERIPENRQDRVVVFDPSDSSPVGFNPLDTNIIGIDGLLHVLRSLWTPGPRLSDVLHAGLLTLAKTPGHSLPELPLLLTDAAFRRPLVAAAVADDPLGLGTFWSSFEGLSGEARAQVLAPVMTRLRAFILRPELRAVLGQSTPRFDLSEVYTKRRCLLVRLPKGELGDGAPLLGSLLVAYLWRLSLRRASPPQSRRSPVFMYLDEFQDFLRLPIDLADALVQARGLGVGLVLAHQHLGQLEPSVRSAVLANAGSRVAFHLDYEDAAVMARRSGGRLRPDDFSGLAAYEAYASVMVDNEPTTYGSLTTLPLDDPLRSAEEVLSGNRERWGVPRLETELRLRQLAETGGGTEPAGPLGARRSVGGYR